MPPAVGAAIATGLFSGGAAIAGNKAASSASGRAERFEREQFQRQMALERERDIEAKRQWEALQEANRLKFESDQNARIYQRALDNYNQEARIAHGARRTPYRAISREAVGRLGQILGMDIDVGSAVPNPTWRRPDDYAPVATTLDDPNVVPVENQPGATPSAVDASMIAPVNGGAIAAGPQQASTLGQLVYTDPAHEEEALRRRRLQNMPPPGRVN
jgi:hypothetical protein